jgi:transglutaminase superfamily protein
LKQFINGCRKFPLLSGFEQSIALEAMVGLAATWMGLRIAGFQRWKTMMARLRRKEMRTVGTAAPLDSVARIAQMELAVASHLPFRTNCLEQSLVLLWLLRRRGIPAELRIGARKESNRFQAHAWVEFDGTVLNDAGAEHLHFVPFDRPVSSMEARTQ